MLAIRNVLDKNKNVLGVEIELDGQFYFIAADQGLWPGIRTGRFPSDDGEPVLIRWTGGILLETQS